MQNRSFGSAPVTTPHASSDKYVLFGLAGETYSLSLLQLQEIIANTQLTVLPNLPRFYHGIISLRGEPIPVLNLRRRFGFDDGEVSRRTRIIIVDLQPNPIGIQVDEVFRVTTIARKDIEPAPALTCGEALPFVWGVSEQRSGKLVVHLDMEKVLNSLEQIHLAEITESIRQAYDAPHDAVGPSAPESFTPAADASAFDLDEPDALPLGAAAERTSALDEPDELTPGADILAANGTEDLGDIESEGVAVVMTDQDSPPATQGQPSED